MIRMFRVITHLRAGNNALVLAALVDMVQAAHHCYTQDNYTQDNALVKMKICGSQLAGKQIAQLIREDIHICVLNNTIQGKKQCSKKLYVSKILQNTHMSHRMKTSLFACKQSNGPMRDVCSNGHYINIKHDGSIGGFRARSVFNNWLVWRMRFSLRFAQIRSAPRGR